MNRPLTALLASMGLPCSLPSAARHSFAAEFDGAKPVRLVGVITSIEWTNPHSYFYLDVKDSKGVVTNWGCEAGNPGALSRLGWKRGEIKFGDTLIVDGYPSISPDGHWLAFTSTRDAAPGTHTTGVYLEDISSLDLGP